MFEKFVKWLEENGFEYSIAPFGIIIDFFEDKYDYIVCRCNENMSIKDIWEYLEEYIAVDKNIAKLNELEIFPPFS